MERRPEQLLWMREILGHVFHMVRRWLCGNTDDLLPRHVRAVQLAVWRQLVWIPLRVHVCDGRADSHANHSVPNDKTNVSSDLTNIGSDNPANAGRRDMASDFSAESAAYCIADRIAHDARSSCVQARRNPHQDNNV